jgi:hypothetical protein
MFIDLRKYYENEKKYIPMVGSRLGDGAGNRGTSSDH